MRQADTSSFAASLDAGLSGATRVYFIVGDPIAQVRSPSGVTAALRAAGRKYNVAIDDLAAPVAPQGLISLAANAQHRHRLALALQARGIGARQAGDIGVKAAAQTALGRHHDQQVRIAPAGADEQR